MNLLLLDDDPEILSYFRSTLTADGHSIHASGDPSLALQEANLENLDCVITDLDMPNMNGLDVIARIRREKPTILIIAISGYRSDSTNFLQLAKWAGANATLAKPFTAQQLRSLLSSLPGEIWKSPTIPGITFTR